jgi:hypothetical protein
VPVFAVGAVCSAAKAAQPERVLEVDPLEHGKHQEVRTGGKDMSVCVACTRVKSECCVPTGTHASRQAVAKCVRFCGSSRTVFVATAHGASADAAAVLVCGLSSARAKMCG